MRFIGNIVKINFDERSFTAVCGECGSSIIVRKRLLTLMDFRNMKNSPVHGNYVEEEKTCENCGGKFQYKILEKGGIVL